ncbi:MAG: translation elongation factor Ts [Candidatus Bipolaricaulia bacterium]
MAEIKSELIRELRAETGVGIMDCKQALIESEGNLEEAKKLLRERGKELFSRASEAVEGQVASYIHHSGKLGVLVEANCQTDFTANSAAFREFVKEVAMHIAAAAPRFLSPEDVPEEVLEQEREIYRHQAEAEGKPSHVIEKIIEGRLNKFYQETCLLNQPYVKDPELTIEDLLGELASRVSEKVVIKRFARFEVGH